MYRRLLCQPACPLTPMMDRKSWVFRTPFVHEAPRITDQPADFQPSPWRISQNTHAFASGMAAPATADEDCSARPRLGISFVAGRSNPIYFKAKTKRCVPRESFAVRGVPGKQVRI